MVFEVGLSFSGGRIVGGWSGRVIILIPMLKWICLSEGDVKYLKTSSCIP